MERLYQVSGCSMEPTLWDGQIVEVMEGYEEGDVVVAEHEGRLIVKRLVGDRLLGDNRALSADFFVADVRILGRVEVRTKEELEERGFQLDNLQWEVPIAEAAEGWSQLFTLETDGSTREKRFSADPSRYNYRVIIVSQSRGHGTYVKLNGMWIANNETSGSYNIYPKNGENLIDIAGYMGNQGDYPYKIIVEQQYKNSFPIAALDPIMNHALSEGSVLSITGSASDADKGDVVTVKYKINSGTVRNIASGVANGTPLSFAKNLTFSNKRLRDGSTEITGDLAENVDHTLTVWAEDDKGEKSAEVTRKFRVIHNRPPVISGTNEDLGTIQAIPSKTYTVTEPEKDAFTVTEKINGKVIRSFAGVAEQENTITIPHDLWIRLQPGIQHKLVIEATDSKGMTAARTYTFVRQENKLEFKLKKPFVTDIAAKRILVTIDAVVPNGATMKIEACNNAFDASPTWEDITNHVRFNRGFLFTNTEKTAEQWGVDIRFMFEKGTANSQVIVNGFGGAFD